MLLRTKRGPKPAATDRSAIAAGAGDATRRARSGIDHSDSLYRTVFDTVKVGIFICDAAGRFTEINEPGCRMFGYTKSELIGSDFVRLSSGVRPYTPERATELLQKAASDGAQLFECQARKKSGVLFWTEISLRFAEFDKNPVVVAIVRDIDERKPAADKLHRAEAVRIAAENSIVESAVLHAVIASIAVLINSSSLDEGAPKALRMVGEALKVDRWRTRAR